MCQRSRTRRIVTTLALAVACGLAFASSAWATSCPDADTQAAGLSPGPPGELDHLPDQRAAHPRSGSILFSRTGPSAGPPSATPTRWVDESYFEHTSPSGLTFIQRIESAGYMRGARAWIVGENLVWGSGALSSPRRPGDRLDEQPTSPREPAEGAVPCRSA